MKKTISFLSVLIVALVFGSQITYAQSGGKFTPEQKEKFRAQIEADLKKLNLTEEQKEPYQEISLKYLDKLKGVKSAGGSRWSKYKKLKAIQKAKNAEMKRLLSSSQYSTYLEIQARRRKELKKMRR
ncbi:MAG TPA: hypothetical protein DCS93_27550 [Microscillaceae bacterium]|nr:hypothetical protein [Microscillaceae bacterium]